MSQFQEKTFDDIWTIVILPIIHSSFEEMEKDYRNYVDAKVKDEVAFRHTIEREFKQLRHRTKQLVYHKSNKEMLLDSRKLGAILCAALIAQKPIEFDVDLAKEQAQDKRNSLKIKDYNVWACDHYLVNYKIAYLCSIFLVYYGCLYCLNNGEEIFVHDFMMDQKDRFCNKLEQLGRLIRYPSCRDFDAFGINMIISLARMDTSNQKLNIEMYALQLWQMEMYTYRSLELWSVSPDSILDDL